MARILSNCTPFPSSPAIASCWGHGICASGGVLHLLVDWHSSALPPSLSGPFTSRSWASTVYCGRMLKDWHAERYVMA